MLLTLAENCPHLQFLSLFESRGYTAEGVMRLIAGCRQLRRVEVGDHAPPLLGGGRRCDAALWHRLAPQAVITDEQRGVSYWRGDDWV